MGLWRRDGLFSDPPRYGEVAARSADGGVSCATRRWLTHVAIWAVSGADAGAGAGGGGVGEAASNHIFCLSYVKAKLNRLSA